jgi:RNA polymerase sigma factor (sigma-70 family)
VEPMNKAEIATVRPMTLEQLEAFYHHEYLKLVKVLVLLGATTEEAEDAVQKAMVYFSRRFLTAQAPEHPAAYVRRAAIRYFIKERQRERKRLPRELQGGHLVIEEHLDDQLTHWEDEQYIEHLLGFLTTTQRKVIKLVMDGLSTPEIAKALGKSNADIRQHLKNGKARLKGHPEIAQLAPGQSQGDGDGARAEPQDQGPDQQGAKATVGKPEPRKEGVQ